MLGLERFLEEHKVNRRGLFVLAEAVAGLVVLSACDPIAKIATGSSASPQPYIDTETEVRNGKPTGLEYGAVYPDIKFTPGNLDFNLLLNPGSISSESNLVRSFNLRVPTISYTVITIGVSIINFKQDLNTKPLSVTIQRPCDQSPSNTEDYDARIDLTKKHLLSWKIRNYQIEGCKIDGQLVGPVSRSLNKTPC